MHRIFNVQRPREIWMLAALICAAAAVGLHSPWVILAVPRAEGAVVVLFLVPALSIAGAICSTAALWRGHSFLTPTIVISLLLGLICLLYLLVSFGAIHPAILFRAELFCFGAPSPRFHLK